MREVREEREGEGGKGRDRQIERASDRGRQLIILQVPTASPLFCRTLGRPVAVAGVDESCGMGSVVVDIAWRQLDMR